MVACIPNWVFVDPVTVAGLPGVELVASDKEFHPVPVIPVDPAAVRAPVLEVTGASVLHLGAIFPDPLVVTPLFGLWFPATVAGLPVGEIVTSDKELGPAPVIPVDPTAVRSPVFEVAGVSVLHLGAIFPNPLIVAPLIGVVLPVVPASVAGFPGVEFITVDPEFAVVPIVPVDPTAVGFSFSLAWASPVHPGAVLPDPLVVASPAVAELGSPGHIVVEGDRCGILKFVHQVFDLDSIS